MGHAEMQAGGGQAAVTEVFQQGGGETVEVPRPKGEPQRRATRTRGLGRVYLRGETWWVQYSYRGELQRESSGSTVRSKAVNLLKRRLAEVVGGRLVGPQAE